MPVTNEAVNRVVANPHAMLEFLQAAADDPSTDTAQVLARVQVPGSKTVIFGIEPENYDPDPDDDVLADAWRLTEGRCPEAWSAGVAVGLDVPCARPTDHRGWHQNAAGDVRWSGKLTPAERDALSRLRAAAEAEA